MAGTGTIVNVALIIFGGIVGSIAGNKLSKKIRETVLYALGIVVLFVGMGGAFEQIFIIENGKIATSGTMMMIVSMALGAAIGEIIDIDNMMNRFGEFLKKKTGNEGDNEFINSFVAASCTVCIGAMAIVGAVQDALMGDPSLLIAKGVIDAVFIGVMAASGSKGCIFSAIPTGIWQGLVTVLALLIGPFLSEQALNNISLVGSILIFIVGVNLLEIKKIRVANLMPAIVIAALWKW